MVDYNGFYYRQKLVFSNSAFEIFHNFPVLFILDDTDGRYPELDVYNKIDFRDRYNNSLSWECAEFNDGGKSYYFVKIPIIKVTDTDHIYVYFGGNTTVEDKTGVWDSNYKVVHHMKDETTSTTLDSTSNDNDGTKKGANEPIEAAGDIGLCQDFDGGDDFIKIASDASLNPGTNDFTIEVLLKRQGIGTVQRICNKRETAASKFYNMWWGSDNKLYAEIDAGGVGYSVFSSNAAITNTDFHLVAARFNRDANGDIFIDTALDGTPVNISAQAGNLNPTSNLNIGGYGVDLGNPTTWYFNGLIAEFRLSTILRTENYLKAQDKILRQQDYVSYQGIESNLTSDVADIVNDALEIKVIKEINSWWGANLTLKKNDYIKEGSYVEVEDENYVVTKIFKIKIDGKMYFRINLDHEAVYELRRKQVKPFGGYIGQLAVYEKLADVISDDILSGTGWTLGDIDDVSVAEVGWYFYNNQYVTGLEALNLLAEFTGKEVYFNSSDKTVDFVYAIGNETKLQIRYDKNSKAIEKIVDATKLCTRVYPTGKDFLTINTLMLQDCDDISEWTVGGDAAIAQSTEIKQQGSGSMHISFAIQNDEAIIDFGLGNEVDLSGYDTLKIWIYPTFNMTTIRFGMGETNWFDNTWDLALPRFVYWNEVEIDISGIADADKNEIRHLGFQSVAATAVRLCYVDSIRAFNGDIYLDSANINRYPEPIEKHIKTTYEESADIEKAGQDYLDDNNTAILKYKAQFADLSEFANDTWEDEVWGLGDTARVYDNDLDINVDVRIQKFVKDILNPDRTKITLSNKVHDITETISDIYKRLKYAMPFEDNRRIVNANAIRSGYTGN